MGGTDALHPHLTQSGNGLVYTILGCCQEMHAPHDGMDVFPGYLLDVL